MATLLAGAFAAVAGVLPGCTKSLNNELPLIQAEPATVDPAAAEPSLDGLSRRHWDELTISWVTGRVQHQPTYVENLQLAADAPRETGAYPTVDNVATVDRDPAAQAAQAALGYPHAAWLVVRAPVIAIFENRWPWSVTTSPEFDFEQLPDDSVASDEAGRRWLGVAPAGEAVSTEP